tara:strand:- start:165 stop:794 length:630 start_codon:yes stop_codon:yes gene_type:complete
MSSNTVSTAEFFSRVLTCKEFARNEKNDFPTLKYSQILDVAAEQFFGYKKFHLIKAEYRKKIDGAALVSESGTAKCPICDLTFSPQDQSDVSEHRKIHERFDKYYLATSYAPAGYAERESLKANAHKLLKNEDTDTEIAHWEIIFRSWFDRSLSSAIRGGFGLKHPEYQEYCSMVVSDLSPKPACINRLIEKFGTQPGVIPAGQTFWSP